jgi:hypothetical protein
MGWTYFLAAERVRLATQFASGFVQPLAEFEVLLLHFGQVTNQRWFSRWRD